MEEKTVRLTARISEQAHSRLTSEAKKLRRNARSPIPYGELLDAILMDLAGGSEEEDWEELREIVLSERQKRKELKMEKDRHRKRAKAKPTR